MKTLSYKGYEGTVEIDVDQDVCRGKILFVNDLVTYVADTPRLLRKAFKEAVDDYLATCEAVGKRPEKPFRGSFNVRIPPEKHRDAALRAVRDGVSLNEVVGRALDCYLYARADVQHNVTVKMVSDTKTIVAAATTQTPDWHEVSTTHATH